MVGIGIGRTTVPTNSSASPSPTVPQAFVPASPAKAAPEIAPVATPLPPLPKGMTGSAKLAVNEKVVTGKVVGITDGDSLTLLSPNNEQIKVRLEGIDAPESSQEYGNKAKQALSALVYGRTVNATITSKDRYERSLAWIEVDGVSVNRKMVADGWAWQYRQYNSDPDLAKLQEKAKASELGLWAASNPPMAPWEYRALGRSPSSAPAAPSASVEKTRATEPSSKAESSGAKYWINTNGVRHNGRCRWYGNTKRGHFSDTAEGRACGICGG